MKINNVIKSLSASNAAIKNTASLEPKDGWYPTYSASGQDVWLPNYRFEQKGIVVSAVGARCGKAFKADGKWNVCANTHPLSVDETIADRDYCWYMLNNENWWIKGGTAQPFVKVKDSLNREHNFPSITVQKEIVAELDKISSIIDLRNAELQKLDELVKARFVELFGDPISNPMNWNKRTLKEVCTKLNDGTHFSPESFSMGDYKYITAKNIKASGFDFSNITYVPEAVHRPIFERCNPEQGDVLYIKDGATTGIAIVNTLKEEFTLLSSVALLKQNRNVINGYFLAALLNNADMYSDIRNNMGGAAITRLTIAKLNAVKVIVPPLDLQNRFAAFVEQVDKSKVVA